jgi:hypothetical protein
MVIMVTKMFSVSLCSRSRHIYLLLARISCLIRNYIFGTYNKIVGPATRKYSYEKYKKMLGAL